MSKHILKTMRLPMSQQDQNQLAQAMEDSCRSNRDDRVAILCQPSIQAKEWQIVFLSPELHARIQAVLDKAKK